MALSEFLASRRRWAALDRRTPLRGNGKHKKTVNNNQPAGGDVWELLWASGGSWKRRLAPGSEIWLFGGAGPLKTATFPFFGS